MFATTRSITLAILLITAIIIPAQCNWFNNMKDGDMADISEAELQASEKRDLSDTPAYSDKREAND